MSESNEGRDSPGDTAARGGAPPKRKGASVWVGLAFVGLLCAGFVISQMSEYSGPEVGWRRDLQGAQAEAREVDRRVFLYIHRANCPTTSEHDRGLFKQRFARETIAKMVPCRIETQRGTPIAGRFRFDGDPLMIVLGPDGKEVYRLEGPVDQRQFSAFIRPN